MSLLRNVVCGVGGVTLLLAIPAEATVVFPHTGLLESTSESAAISGLFRIAFALHEDEQGEGEPLWEETYAEVAVDRGYYTLPLGEPSLGRAIPRALVAGRRSLWVEIVLYPPHEAPHGVRLRPLLRVEAAAMAQEALRAQEALVAEEARTAWRLGTHEAGDFLLKEEFTIAPRSIEGPLLALGAVTAEHLEAGAVTHQGLAAGAVRTDHLAKASVSGEKLASGAVGSSQLAEGAVGAAHLQLDSASLWKVSGGQLSYASASGFEMEAGLNVKGALQLEGTQPLRAVVSGHGSARYAKDEWFTLASSADLGTGSFVFELMPLNSTGAGGGVVGLSLTALLNIPFGPMNYDHSVTPSFSYSVGYGTSVVPQLRVRSRWNNGFPFTTVEMRLNEGVTTAVPFGWRAIPLF